MGRIDARLHNVVPSTEAVFPSLAEHWRETVTQTLFKGAVDPSYPRSVPTSARPDTAPPDGPPGSSLEKIREQVLDADAVEIGILTSAYPLHSLPNPDAPIACPRPR